MTHPIYVLYQSDDNYAQHMGISIYSMLENNKNAEVLEIFVIDDHISEDNKEKISSLASEYDRKLTWISSDLIRSTTIVSKWPKYSSFRKNTNCYLKYFIFDGILDSKVDRIMYIDADSIVSGSLQPLFEMDMQGKAIGMTRCCLVTKEYRNAIGFGQEDSYYNAGMNLFDSAAWHDRKYPEKLIQKATEGRMYSTVDQDLLNFVVRGDVIDLGCRYNFQCMHYAFKHPMYSKVYRPTHYYSDEEVEEATESPVINHFLRFAGMNPWNSNSLHPCREMYEAYRSTSPWKDAEPKPTGNNGYKFKISRLLYKILPRSIYLRVFKKFHNKYLISSDKKAKEAVLIEK